METKICFKNIFEVKNQCEKSSLIIVDYKIQKDHSDWNRCHDAFCWKLTPSHLLIASMNSTQLLDGLVSLSRMKCQICSCIEANKCSGFSILNAVGLDGLDSAQAFFSTQCSICMFPPRRFHLGGFLWSMRSSSSMHPSAQRSRGGRPRVRDRMLRRWCETFQNYSKFIYTQEMSYFRILSYKLASSSVCLDPHFQPQVSNLSFFPGFHPLSLVYFHRFLPLFLWNLWQLYRLIQLGTTGATHHRAKVRELEGLEGILWTTLLQHRREMR